ncbi:MAG: Crp/Fnr family transcriptional regulator [Bacteroidia bacterium]|nr:Crp/Fnr family transcriptional regulator [Bacteroidia bacterium]
MHKESVVVDCNTCKARCNSVFSGLFENEIDMLRDNKGCTTFKKGQVIFNQGGMPHGIFVVYSGKVKLFQLAENGREQIVRMAKPGDIIGYRSLLSSENYASTAVPIEESNICYIPKKLFWSLMNSNQDLSLQIMKLLSSDLKRAEHSITNIAQKPVKERLAEALLFLKETYGLEQDEMTIGVVMTREDMANFVGTATETAIRLLADLRHDNIIDFVGKKIKIINYRKLIDLANLDD